MIRPTHTQINLSAIHQNTTALLSLLPPKTSLCAVIKADAYNHGAIPIAQTTLKAGASSLAVAILDEAIQLRQANITAPILILGATPPQHAPAIAHYNLEQTVFSLNMAQALSNAATTQNIKLRIHLKIDTGMTRLGIQPHEAAHLAKSIATLPNIAIHGAYTHFATADSHNPTHTQQQITLFKEALASLKKHNIHIPCRHAANSAAILNHDDSHFDMVRAGIALYGLWPSPETKRRITLTSAMRLKTKVAMVKDVPKGTAISYGRRHITPTPARIATLPIGYADGFSRMISGKAHVLVEGKPAPVVGTICMDQCMIDVTGIDNVHVGSDVLLWGNPQLPVEDVAAALGTVNYEVVCMVGKRVPRVYVDAWEDDVQ